jgi:hypothetical protein
MLAESMNPARYLARALLEPFVGPVQRLRGRFADEPSLAAVLLLALLFCAARTLRGDRLAALLLIPMSFAWLLFNGPLEGPTLIALSWSHGITASDLISVTGLLLAFWRLAPRLARD